MQAYRRLIWNVSLAYPTSSRFSAGPKAFFLLHLLKLRFEASTPPLSSHTVPVPFPNPLAAWLGILPSMSTCFSTCKTYPDLSRARGRYPKPAYQIPVKPKSWWSVAQKITFFHYPKFIKNYIYFCSCFREDYTYIKPYYITICSVDIKKLQPCMSRNFSSSGLINSI